MKTVILSLSLILSNVLLSQSKIEVSFSDYKLFSIEDSVTNPSVISQSELLLEETTKCFYIFDLSLCKMFFYENDLLVDVGDIISFNKSGDNYTILISTPNKFTGEKLTSCVEISSLTDKKNTNFVLSWYYKEVDKSFSFVAKTPDVLIKCS
jgi:hypothetical protein